MFNPTNRSRPRVPLIVCHIHSGFWFVNLCLKCIVPTTSNCYENHFRSLISCIFRLKCTVPATSNYFVNHFRSLISCIFRTFPFYNCFRLSWHHRTCPPHDTHLTKNTISSRMCDYYYHYFCGIPIYSYMSSLFPPYHTIDAAVLYIK